MHYVALSQVGSTDSLALLDREGRNTHNVAYSVVFNQLNTKFICCFLCFIMMGISCSTLILVVKYLTDSSLAVAVFVNFNLAGAHLVS